MAVPVWDEEADARTVLEGVLGGSTEQVDPGGGPRQVHDFTLTLPSGRTVAVEVTRFADPQALQQRAEVAKRAHRRYPALRHNWQVKITGRYNVDDWLKSLEPLLIRLEDDELDSMVVHLHAEDDEYPIEANLRRLGVTVMYHLDEAEADGAKILLTEANHFGTTAPDVVVDVGSILAANADNIRKLTTAEEDEKHLFIWIDSDQHQASAAIGSDRLPTGHPVLPRPVDALWVATAYQPTHVWRYSPDRGWEDYGTVQLRPNDPQ